MKIYIYFSLLTLLLWGATSDAKLIHRKSNPGRPTDSKPTLVIQGDKTYQWSAVTISNRGQWVAASDVSSSGHGGSGIKIFEGQSGLQWGEFPPAAGVTPLRFTPDATRILTTMASDALNGEQTQVSLCAVPSGRTLRTFTIAPFPIWCDNTRLRGIQENSLVEFDMKTGKQNSKRKIQDAPQGGRFGPRYAFSENGNFLVEGSSEVIRFWKAQTGDLLGRIEAPQRAIGAAAISNDGTRLASEGEDPNWSPPTDGPMTEAAFARVFRLHVWNVQTRKLIRTFPGYYSLSGGASLLAFSPDGRTLFGAGADGLDRFQIATGKNAPLPPVVPSQKNNSQNRMGRPLDVSSDGLWLAGVGPNPGSSDFGTGLSFWSLASSKLRARTAGTLHVPDQVKWSPDEKYLAGGGRLTLWDAHSGKLLIEKPGTYAEDFAWVDASTIRSQTLSKMQLWSVPDLKLKFEFDFSPPQKDEYSSNHYTGGLSIAPDGRTILTTDTSDPGGTLKGELWVWDVASKQLLRKIKTDKDLWGFTQMHEILWLPDNRRVVFSTQTKLVLLDTQTGTIEHEQADPNDPNAKAGAFQSILRPLRISPDGKWVAVRARSSGEKAAKSSYQVLIFDLNTFALNPPDGLQWWQATIAAENKLRADGAPLAGNDLSSLGDLSPDGRLVAYGSNNLTRNGVVIWNVQEGREAARLYLLGGSEKSPSTGWIALTPAGFYNASPAGEQRLRWRDGNTFWPLEKSRARFKRPDLVARALNPPLKADR